MRLNINTALITSKQRGNQNIAVISNYFWFDYSLKPYVSCIDAVFTESEEQVKGKGAVYGYFIYSLLNIAHNYEIRPDTHYPTVLSENESEKPFSALPVAKKGLSDLFINILPSAIDGFAVSYRLVSDGQNIGFGIKDTLKVGEGIYKVYPNFLRVMKLPDEDLLIKRANFPVRVKIRARKKGKKGGDISVELPTLIDGLFSKTLNKHIGVIPDRVLNSPRLEHLPQDWITWEDYRPVVCGQTLDTYKLITPPDEDVLDFVNYLKSTYNKPVYLLVSVEFLLGSTITYSAFAENVSQFINSLPVDGVVIQDDFSEGSWVAGAVNPAISTFLRNLYGQINKPKFYLPSYSTVRHVSFQNDTVSISASRNQLFNQTKHGCIYTPPLIPFKECGYTYGGYNANTCDHANYYLQKENKPVLKYEEFMQVYPSLTFIDEPDKMYKPPNLLLNGLNNVVLKQHTFDKDVGLVQFPDVRMVLKTEEASSTGLRVPYSYKFSDIYLEYDNDKWKVQVYSLTEYLDGYFTVSSHEIVNMWNNCNAPPCLRQPTFFMSKYLGLIYFDWGNPQNSIMVLKPILTDSPVFSLYPISSYELEYISNAVEFRIDFGEIGKVIIRMAQNYFWFVWQNNTNNPDILAKRKQIECNILYPSAYISISYPPNGNTGYTSGVSLFIPYLVKHDVYLSGNLLNLTKIFAFQNSVMVRGSITQKSIFSIDIARMKVINYYYAYGMYRSLAFSYPNGTYTTVLEYDLTNNLSNIAPALKLRERFFSTITGIRKPPVLSTSCATVVDPSTTDNSPVYIYDCNNGAYNTISNSQKIKYAYFYMTEHHAPQSCRNFPQSDFEFVLEREPPFPPPPMQEIKGLYINLSPAFYYQVYSLNHLATQLRNKTVFWNAFYLTPFWQVFTFSRTQDNQEQDNQEQDNKNTITFYYTRIPYNFLAYFINIEADSEQINCCVNPRIVRDKPPNEEIGLNISIPQLPTNNTFTGGNEGQFTWLTPEQSSLLNPYNYVNSKLTTHKPFLTSLYEKFYRRVDKQAFLEPVLAYVKG
ncbi:MAG: hypothetical protein QXX12_06595, partial [Nanopusillaceae archaeon]